jgi:hypothetical protein
VFDLGFPVDRVAVADLAVPFLVVGGDPLDLPEREVVRAEARLEADRPFVVIGTGSRGYLGHASAPRTVRAPRHAQIEHCATPRSGLGAVRSLLRPQQ